MTKRLIFTGPRGGHVWRTSLNEEAWKRALASAGVIPERKPGESYAESRENGMHALRHFYASVLLDAGENIKALAEYLGHSDPGLTLRVYAHLMPSSQECTRKAVAHASLNRKGPDWYVRAFLCLLALHTGSPCRCPRRPLRVEGDRRVRLCL